MENMLYDGRPDFRSFKKLFDTCASSVDLRLWVAYDVMRWFYPLKGFGENALKTTAYMTEFMKTLGMRESSRAGRGFITLPNPRGEPFDPFAGMFEDNDPNYPQLEEGELERLRLVAEEFEDRNRMAEIVARNRRRAAGAPSDDGSHLVPLESSTWSVEAVQRVVESEKSSQAANMAKLAAGIARRLELDNMPAPSIKDAIKKKWSERRGRKD